MSIIYLKHPVSAEEKKKHRDNGDQILDIVFKPKTEEAEKPKAEKPKVKKATKTKAKKA